MMSSISNLQSEVKLVRTCKANQHCAHHSQFRFSGVMSSDEAISMERYDLENKISAFYRMIRLRRTYMKNSIHGGIKRYVL